ncbi:MAG: winged helix-turn-helix domain-containing protein [Acidimicrobiaceae bacterium]|nr:winged helix-turn-helix domain-containing protein [Acidimicrobiaceae bacterium]
MKVGLLGALEVVDDDGVEVGVTAPKARALLSVLALRAGRVVPVGELMAGLWGDDAPRSAIKTLQGYVSSLRRVLPPGAVESAGSGYRLRVATGDVDALEFERLAAGGVNADLCGDAEAAAARLGEALRLWRGEPLVELADWALGSGEAARLNELRRSCEEQLAEARLSLGEHASLVGDLELAVAAEPLREKRWSQLMLALYRCGRQADALRAFQRFRTSLGDQLGIEPSTGLKSLEEAILLQKPELDWTSPPRPSTEYNDGPRDNVPNRDRSPHGLPTKASSFVGRNAEVRRIAQLLSSHRLVTLAGAGGVGKTRLAIEAARRILHDHPDGVWLAELSLETQPDHVAALVGQAVGVHTAGGADVLEMLVGALQPRRLLVVLDNCEHLIDACAELANAFVQRCPQVQILATSRVPLGVDGEQVMRVSPLPLPPPHPFSTRQVADACSVELFVERAQARSPEVRLTNANVGVISAICHRLDGLPLAIELAAARAGSMALDELEIRLAERFRLLAGDRRAGLVRHRTLWATIDWSYRLLKQAERSLFDRLSVFRGPFDLDAAQKVCGFGAVDPRDVPASLGSLVDNSLVEVDTTGPIGHYTLLETIKQFAAEQLTSGGDDLVHAAQTRHANHFAHWSREVGQGLAGPEFVRSCQLLDSQGANVRAALDHLLADPSRAEDLVQNLVSLERWFIMRRGDGAKYWAALPELLSLVGDPKLRAAVLPRAALGLARYDVGVAASHAKQAVAEATALGDATLLARALACFDGLFSPAVPEASKVQGRAKAVRLARTTGDPILLGECLLTLGNSLLQTDAVPDQALEAFAEAIAVCEQSGDVLILASAHDAMARIAIAQGKLDEAHRHVEAASVLTGDLRDHSNAARAYSLAEIKLCRGDYRLAEEGFFEAFERSLRWGDKLVAVDSCLGLACCAAGVGADHVAAVLFGFAVRERGEVSPMWDALRRPRIETSMNAVMERHDDFAAGYDQGHRMSVGDAFDFVIDNCPAVVAGVAISPSRQAVG